VAWRGVACGPASESPRTSVTGAVMGVGVNAVVGAGSVAPRWPPLRRALDVLAALDPAGVLGPILAALTARGGLSIAALSAVSRGCFFPIVPSIGTVGVCARE
jgi:hypothetical protein